jgi:hypothetical protein
VCKLVLSLSPETDPMCISFAIDYYAIRSQQYEWLIQFVQDFHRYGPLVNPRLICNLAFSAALAKYHIEQKTAKTSPPIEHLGAVTTDIDTKMITHSASYLAQFAIALYPDALRPLLSKTKDTELNKGVWKSALTTLDTLHKPTNWIEKLITVFVERSHSLWVSDAVRTFCFLRSTVFTSPHTLTCVMSTIRYYHG